MSINDELPCQCLCGRRDIPVSPDVFASRSFTGVECDSGCRARYERNGITNNGAPPTRRTPPSQYNRRQTVADRRRAEERTRRAAP